MGLSKGSTGLKVLSQEKSVVNEHANYEVGLAGNPNVGKSTVFNALTGLNQHTGNWPGKTVANAIGTYNYDGKVVSVVDLPGTYSLLSNSEEEEIARDYICFNNPNLMVVVADATSLERNLNLFFQVSEITDNVILCVNLIDEARKKKIKIDKSILEQELGTKVIFTSARSKIGIEELKEVINIDNEKMKIKKLTYDENIEEAIGKISGLLCDTLSVSEKRLRWIAIRLLEGNEGIIKSIIDKYYIDNSELIRIKNIRNKVVIDSGGKSISDLIVECLVKNAERISKKCVTNNSYNTFQRRIDEILVSKITGIPIMIIMLMLILWITITLANYPSGLLSNLFSKGEAIIRNSNIYSSAPSWLSGILVDGVYVTLAWVISVMLPPMAIFFPLFTLLEDSGYLPRIAFNLDRCFKRCGSCGKQALTMCMGLGCNAAGVIGCRIINSPRERIIAILTNGFTPCNGRFPMLISIASIFIGGGILGGISGDFIAAISVTVIIIIGVIMTLLVSKILSLTVLKGINSNFILELPPYRRPQIGSVIIRSLLDRTIYVLGRAISVAAPAGAIIWIFANVKIGDISVLTYCANFLEPFANLIGLDGYILMGFILGLPANEIVVPIIIMSYLRTSTIEEMNTLQELKSLLVANGWTILTAINVMLLCLMHYPCGTTLWTIKKETKSLKWTILAFLIPTIAGIIICFCTTQIYRFVF